MTKKIINRDFLKNIIFFSTFTLSLFIIFGLMNENSDKIQSIQYMIIEKIINMVVCFLACTTIFYLTKEIKVSTKYSKYLLFEILGIVPSIIIGSIAYFISYSVYYLVATVTIGYEFKINLLNVLNSLLFIGIYFILIELIKFIKYKIEKGYKINQIFYIILSIIMIFLFIFIKNSYIFILFYSLVAIFSIHLIYYGIILFNKYVMTHKSSFVIINNMIIKKMIRYYSLSILVLFIGLMALFSDYNKHNYNKSFYRYDYETLDTLDELKTFLADSPLARYTVLEDKYDFIFKKKHFCCYSLDLSSVQTFFDIKFTEKLSSIPSNAIILPEISKRELRMNIGDSLLTNVNGKEYIYTIYGFYESGNDIIAFTNVTLNDNNKKLLIELENKEMMNYIENRFSIKAYDSNEIEKSFIHASLVSFIISIITFVGIVLFILIMYFKEKSGYYNSIKEVQLKLENAGIMKRRMKRLILDSLFVEFVASLITISIFVILLTSIYKDMIMNIFRIYKGLNFLDYLTYLFMIFIFYNIILILEYLLGRGYYEKKKS